MQKSRLIQGFVFSILIFSLVNHPTAGQSPSVDVSIETDAVGYEGYIVPISFVADYFFYEQQEFNSTKVDMYVDTLLEDVNEIYFNSSIPVFYELKSVSILDDETINNATITYSKDDGPNNGYNVSKILNSFSDYIDSLMTYQVEEEVQLLSGVDFENSVIGLAYLADTGINYDAIKARSVIQATFSNIVGVATTSAHEIGHNYGATHDGDGGNTGSGPNICASNGFVMSPSVDVNNPDTTFSSCSISEINLILDHHLDASYVDNSIPLLDYIGDIELQKEIGGYYTMTWTVSDDNLGYYSIFNNEILLLEYKRFDGSELTYDIDVSTVQNVTIEMEVYDLVGHLVETIIEVSIVGDITPRIDSDGDLSVFDNSSSVDLNWNITDNGNSTHVDVYQNGSLVDSFNFTSSIEYTYTMTDVIVGTHNFTIVVYDELNQTSTDTTIVEIKKTPLPPPPEDNGDQIPDEPTDSDQPDDESVDLLGELSLNNVGVLVFLIAIPVLRSRLVKNQ